MKDKFKDLRIVDNFYQTSSFFPMPTLLISTLDEEGNTTCGAYSLCFPYYIAGKDSYTMLLECRNSSNTAQNILRTKKCAINFLPDNYSYFKEIVRLGFPGETSKEKMSKFKFSVGPWNVHSGMDAYGPATRDEIPFEEKIGENIGAGTSLIQKNQRFFMTLSTVPNFIKALPIKTAVPL